MFDLAGQVAVVTGGAVGLGSSFAGALARQGADIVVMDIAEDMQATARMIETIGRRCLCIQADVSTSRRLCPASRSS